MLSCQVKNEHILIIILKRFLKTLKVEIQLFITYLLSLSFQRSPSPSAAGLVEMNKKLNGQHVASRL